MRILKERMLSFILTVVMLVSLLTGMTPTGVQAAVTQEPTEEELNCKLTTVDVTLEVGNEYIQCSELPEPTNSNYKWAYFYYPAPSDMEGYEEGVLGLIASTQESIGVATMSGCKAAHREEYGLLVKDVPSNGQIPVSGDGYGLLYIIQIYDYPIDVDNSGCRYYYNKVAMFDVSKEGTISNGLSGGAGNENPPVADSCTVTIDSTNLAEGALLSALRFGSDGYEIGDFFELTNGSAVEIPKDGGLLVMSNSSNFNVTVSDTTLANVGDLMVGDAESGYYISEIKGNITVVVESTTQGGGNETPTPDEGRIKDLASIVEHDEDTNTFTVTLDPNKRYVISNLPFEYYNNLGMSAATFNENFRDVDDKVATLKTGNSLESFEGVTNIYELDQALAIVKVYDAINLNTLVTGQSQAMVSLPNGGVFMVHEIKDGDGTERQDSSDGLSGTYYITAGIHGKFVPAVETSAHTHTLTLVPEKPATCTEDGYKAYQKCSDESCGKLFKEDGTTEITEVEKIPASHSWVTDAWEKDATNHWHKCSKCTEVKDKAAHVDANTDNKCDTCGYEKEVVVTAPVITKQPQNVSVKVDEKATFSVTATGDNLKYQWQINRNDGNGFVNISDATSASYETSEVDMSCNGFKYQCIISNDGGNVTSTTATLTVTEKEVTHTHSLTKVAEKAATCTEAGNKAYYTCSGCDSLYADAEGTTVTTLEAVTVKALGHDMTEATCTEKAVCQRTGCDHTEEALGHDWSGEWTVIKEATATEEGKKETLCTRDCGQKKVVIIPKTGEVDESENLEKDAEVAPDSPIDEATLNNTKEELLDSDIFTDKEKQDIKDGEDARVWLEVDKLDEDVIPSADKAKVEKEAEKIAGENATITYFDASLFKQIGNGKKTGIEKPGIDMKITIVIPKALLNDDDDMVREYKIIRLHKGEVDIITGEFNEETGEYSFETDRFSTYAIVYGDTPVVPEAPKTGDATNFMPILALLFVGLGLVVGNKRKSF